MFLKICGLTRLDDALLGVECGATALGFVFWPRSPRAIAPAQARAIVAAIPAHVLTVGVFVNEPADGIRRVVDTTGIGAVQLHGDEVHGDITGIGRPLFRSVTLDDVDAIAREWPEETTLLLDASDRVRRGGTGTAVDWSHAADVARRHRIVLAGGLTPLNVEEAIRIVQPYGVDVSSGVEASHGVKDREKLTRFIANARRALTVRQKPDATSADTAARAR